MTPVANLTDSEIMRELVDLAESACPDERRVLFWLITSRPVPDVSHEQLRDAYADLPDAERSLQLTFSRRIVAVGQATYGPLDVRRDRRDYRAEAVEEDVDGAIYRACELLSGADPDPLLSDSVDLARRSILAAIRRGSI